MKKIDQERTFAGGIEFAIRLAVLGLLLYWSFVLVRPFVTIVIWSTVLTVALYPPFDWLASHLGGRRRLAAFIITIASLLIVIGPATWLVLNLIDSLRTLAERLDWTTIALPRPPQAVKAWPLIGDQIYQLWDLASTNLRAALTKIAPQLKPVGGGLLRIAAGAGISAVQFFVSIIVAGFLFCPAPSMVRGIKTFAGKLALGRAEEFVDLAGATIRVVSRGVIGISALQALLIGIGFVLFGVPAASLLTSAALIFGIIQIGPALVVFPVVIWGWMTMETTTALAFTAYMVPVNLLDNILKPFIMGRGLKTPMLVTLIGVLGGTIAYGISGLFLGPIVLAVIWELLNTWTVGPESA
jgi:predicted PurR-regulated permease PerM